MLRCTTWQRNFHLQSLVVTALNFRNMPTYCTEVVGWLLIVEGALSMPQAACAGTGKQPQFYPEGPCAQSLGALLGLFVSIIVVQVFGIFGASP